MSSFDPTAENILVALRNRVQEMEDLVVAVEMTSDVASGPELHQLIARRAGVQEALRIATEVASR